MKIKLNTMMQHNERTIINSKFQILILYMRCTHTLLVHDISLVSSRMLLVLLLLSANLTSLTCSSLNKNTERDKENMASSTPFNSNCQVQLLLKAYRHWLLTDYTYILWQQGNNYYIDSDY